MGILYMKREFGFRHKGYGYGTDILYVYCDKCGSFSIKTYISLEKWLSIIISSALVTIVIFAPHNVSRFIVLLIGLLIYWLIFKHFWEDKNYKCRKCGNTQIIINHPKDYASVIPKYNTLDYPSKMEVLDVSDHLTQKRYQGYWDDEYR